MLQLILEFPHEPILISAGPFRGKHFSEPLCRLNLRLATVRFPDYFQESTYARIRRACCRRFRARRCRPRRYRLWAEQLDQQSQTVPWLWEGYLAPGNVTLLTSQWKSGKTTLVSILLSRLKEGGTLAGLPLHPGRAVVVSEESGPQWALRHARLQFRKTFFMCRPFRSKPTMAQWLALLERVARLQGEHGMNLFVLDTLATFLPGRNEACAGVMMEALLPIQELTAGGMSVLLLHHPSKGQPLPGQAARGSGALASFVDINIEMSWCSHAADADRRRKVLAFSRYDQTPRQRVIELNADGTDYLVHGSFQDDEFLRHWDQVKMVLEDAKGKRTRRDLLDDWPADFPRPGDMTLVRWLNRAVALGLVLEQGTGRKNDPFRYWLPGQEELWRQDPMYELHRQIEEANREVMAAMGKARGAT